MSAQTYKTARQRGKLAPIRFAHAVLQTNQLSRMLDWYRTVLEADIQFSNDGLCKVSTGANTHITTR
jgi:hypothetical protein